MRFLILGYDGTDSEAMARRLAVRDKHLAGSQRMYAAGHWQDSGALLNEDGAMVGSFIICDYPSRDEMEKTWLNTEPYVLGKVWKKIEVHPIQLSPRACSYRESC